MELKSEFRRLLLNSVRKGKNENRRKNKKNSKVTWYDAKGAWVSEWI